MIIILMGVSGSGKTTIGNILAKKLGWQFLDADGFHPQRNIEKMSKGIPLDDADRLPWLNSMNTVLKEKDKKAESLILACSALKESYRDLLTSGIAKIHWIYLKGGAEIVRERIKDRDGHFMKADMLDSQFAILEEPANSLVFDINDSPESITESILSKLPKENSLFKIKPFS